MSIVTLKSEGYDLDPEHLRMLFQSTFQDPRGKGTQEEKVEFLQMDAMQTLRWLRVIGDTIFASGIFALGYFVVGLRTGWSLTSFPDPITENVSTEARKRADAQT